MLAKWKPSNVRTAIMVLRLKAQMVAGLRGTPRHVCQASYPNSQPQGAWRLSLSTWPFGDVRRSLVTAHHPLPQPKLTPESRGAFSKS